jgi:hypothetical protein
MPLGGPVKLRVPAGDIAVHYRGGAIVPKQRYAPLTRDVRLAPITLVVALPASAAAAAPVPPYALEARCAAVRARSAGQLVSCGHVYMDGGEDIATSTANSVQVWFSAVAAPGGESGTLSSSVVSHAGEAAGKLAVEAVHILGAPAAAKGGVMLEAAKAASVLVNGEPAPAAYDAAAGVIRLSGLDLPLGEPLSISWSV